MSQNNEEVVISEDGLQKLKKELEYLRGTKRREVAKRIKQALDFGDISENSEYDDAKNEQAFLEGRIKEIEHMVKNAKVISKDDIDTTKVGVGTTVRVQDLDTDEVIEYEIVGPAETDPDNNLISNKSPIGRNLIGNKIGDEVEIEVPMGTINYKVLAIRK